ncbi:hypothetical protein CH63R_03803 [Colletotrichum higginsianum IMI 349063]|uniref:Uncharacterized protein n=1 Tax=Colletotrichum higginsianum (strain IMI 349063) TaxID=759273 RepID=A0A1B7YHF1_COLHI|nr:hypothetical protein CH63R_03803 [Colletotrichum higginsianum IMI 349063]OBR11507.1 hypothetical protein CH63R_03803 [Colletotrichum higginsianum IMI 349063]
MDGYTAEVGGMGPQDEPAARIAPFFIPPLVPSVSINESIYPHSSKNLVLRTTQKLPQFSQVGGGGGEGGGGGVPAHDREGETESPSVFTQRDSQGAAGVGTTGATRSECRWLIGVLTGDPTLSFRKETAKEALPDCPGLWEDIPPPRLMSPPKRAYCSWCFRLHWETETLGTWATRRKASKVCLPNALETENQVFDAQDEGEERV